MLGDKTQWKHIDQVNVGKLGGETKMNRKRESPAFEKVTWDNFFVKARVNRLSFACAVLNLP